MNIVGARPDRRKELWKCTSAVRIVTFTDFCNAIYQEAWIGNQIFFVADFLFLATHKHLAVQVQQSRLEHQ